MIANCAQGRGAVYLIEEDLLYYNAFDYFLHVFT